MQELPDIEPIARVYKRELRPSLKIVSQARLVATDPAMRPENLATIVLDDPVTVLELLQKANAVSAGGSAPLSSLEPAITRLGQEGLTLFFNQLEKQHSSFKLPDQALSWYEIYIERSRRIGWVARYFAEVLGSVGAQRAQISSSLYALGDVLAVVHLGLHFVKLVEETKEHINKLNFRLVHELEFDPEYIAPRYLERRGLVTALNIFTESAETAIEEKKRSELRLIAKAAREMVLVYERKEWEKYHPRENLPPRSAVRLLRFPSADSYATVYGKAHEFFFKMERSEREENKSTSEIQEKP